MKFIFYNCALAFLTVIFVGPQAFAKGACPVDLKQLFAEENTSRVISGSAHFSCKAKQEQPGLSYFRGAVLRYFPWQKIDEIRKNYSRDKEVKEIMKGNQAEYFLIENKKTGQKLACTITDGAVVRDARLIFEFCYVASQTPEKPIAAGESLVQQFKQKKDWHGKIASTFHAEQKFTPDGYPPVTFPAGFFIVSHSKDRVQVAETSGLVQGEVFYQKTRVNLNSPESLKIYRKSLIESMKKMSGWELVSGADADCQLFKDTKGSYCSYCSEATQQKNTRLTFLLVFSPEYTTKESLIDFQKNQLKKWISAKPN